MYIKKLTATTVDLIFNKPAHGIDWAVSAPGALVVLLDAGDFQSAADWKNAGSYAGGVAPALIADSEDRNPGDPGYADTYDSGTPAVWALAGNQVCMLSDGTVELRDNAGVLQSTLTGTVVQAEA